MRVLLDTNIVIHRESRQATNYTIGTLFYWIDKLHYEKLIHPLTVRELRKAQNADQQEIYDARLSAYTQMRSIAPQTDEYIALLADVTKTDNDIVDNQLLFEVFCGRADLLITEDRKMRNKALRLGIEDKVLSINGFITKCSNDNPALIEYKALSVKKELFGNINVKDPFFDSFRMDYDGFEKWFASKCDAEAYICRADDNKILGFLYLKTEDENENYSDITPVFRPMKRLKVGTFKVESTGFRLGERFIKIIFDNAIERQLSEIYVTLFVHRPELETLHSLLNRWGFIDYGIKNSDGKAERVLVKKLGIYDERKTVKENFPNISYYNQKFFLPIEAKYHTPLLPDSQLKTENEVNFLGDKPQKYALQKVYISFSYKRNMKPGDFLVLYRKGTTPGRKGYESVVSTIGIIDEVKYGFQTKQEFLRYCENRTVFSLDELNDFWNKRHDSILVIKFIYVKSLSRRIILKELWEKGIVEQNSGPRPFDLISDDNFDMIIASSGTSLYVKR